MDVGTFWFGMAIAVMALISLILSAINFDKVQKIQSVSSIADTNGFSGHIQNGQLTLGTTLEGLVKGTNGAFVDASPHDITSQPLTGFQSSTGSLNANDTILEAFGKLNGNASAGASVVEANGFNAAVGPAMTLGTSVNGLLKGLNDALTLATPQDITSQIITGFVSGEGKVSATDSILQALQKVDGNTIAKVNLSGDTMTGDLTMDGNNVWDVGTLSASNVSINGFQPMTVRAKIGKLPEPWGTDTPDPIWYDAALQGSMDFAPNAPSGTVIIMDMKCMVDFKLSSELNITVDIGNDTVADRVLTFVLAIGDAAVNVPYSINIVMSLLQIDLVSQFYRTSTTVQIVKNADTRIENEIHDNVWKMDEINRVTVNAQFMNETGAFALKNFICTSTY